MTMALKSTNDPQIRSVSASAGQERRQSDRRSSSNNGYVEVLVKPLEQGNYNIIWEWLGLGFLLRNGSSNSQHRDLVMTVTGVAILLSAVLVGLLTVDIALLFHKLISITIPIISISFAFYLLAFYLRSTWSTTSMYLLICSCFGGEFIGQWLFFHGGPGFLITRPSLALTVLFSVSISSVFSTLETIQSTLVIALISFMRYTASTSLLDIPQYTRPYIAYVSAVWGIIGAKYMETLFKSPINDYMTQDGKIPVIKRRRSSASNHYGMSAHRTNRRTSLPALIHSRNQNAASSYEAAIIHEAHGLITDMLADSSLPNHVVSGLKAVSNLLAPTDTHVASHKPKVSPLVSLTEASMYVSDSEDLPYTGERPSSLPKRLRRSLPPSLIRRMSTSTWTTTTSATGLPTLEADICRTRSSSFRHSRDNTPGSSPTGSRSNSPSSPNTPTTISLAIPKSRSFSLASIGTSPGTFNSKRFGRERHSLHSGVTPVKQTLPQAKESNLLSPSNVTGNAQVDHDATKSIDKTGSRSPRSLSSPQSGSLPHPGISRRLNITSDYDSCDSPGSSDHSDHVPTLDDIRETQKQLLLDRSEASKQDENGSSKSSQVGKDANSSYQRLESLISEDHEDNMDISLPFDPNDIDSDPLLSTKELTVWDYPIFDLANSSPDTCLSKITYKVFSDVGLLETFRIPLPEFLLYFHELELGYRDKPYHNRLHATDVIHGCYFLTTQPIPGFNQINPDTEVFQRQLLSSSESESEGCDGHHSYQKTSFTAEDTSYGIMGGNFPPLELMAMFAAAAMHDYDHPGRTNAFLVATNAPLAVLYNDRSVLESHHAAAAWRLFLSNDKFNWLCHLEKAEFKKFRYLVIEAILATDLKRHFELLAEFNAKVNDEDASGLDWTQETDRLMAANMVIKLADINGPIKRKDLHVNWTNRITEEFYEQGDEEAGLGLPVSPYMNRDHPQLAKLQESFINHLVAPLCNAVASAGLLPGTWVEDVDTNSVSNDVNSGNNEGYQKKKRHPKTHKIHCWLTKNLKDNHDMWVNVLRLEAAQKEAKQMADAKAEAQSLNRSKSLSGGEKEMAVIKEEETPPNSANSTSQESSSSFPSPENGSKLEHSPQQSSPAKPTDEDTSFNTASTGEHHSVGKSSVSSSSSLTRPLTPPRRHTNYSAIPQPKSSKVETKRDSKQAHTKLPLRVPRTSESKPVQAAAKQKKISEKSPDS